MTPRNAAFLPSFFSGLPQGRYAGMIERRCLYRLFDFLRALFVERRVAALALLQLVQQFAPPLAPGRAFRRIHLEKQSSVGRLSGGKKADQAIVRIFVPVFKRYGQ